MNDIFTLRESGTIGTLKRRPPSSTECVIHEPFHIQANGSIGQTIIGPDGNAVAWTTDVVVAQVICRLMNEQY